MGSSLAVFITTVVALAGAPGGNTPGNVRLRNEGMRTKVERAVAGAAERLARPACAGLLDEFTDAAGMSLRGNLEAAGVPAPEYLERYVLFYNGLEAGRCGKKRVLAMTKPGSRVVLVCWSFFRQAGDNPALDEAIIIHEALHTLGLGENPPSSLEITARVLERCAQ